MRSCVLLCFAALLLTSLSVVTAIAQGACGSTVTTVPQTLLICPAGDGHNILSTSIHIEFNGQPVPNIPKCDFWLIDCLSNGIVLCGGALSSNAATCTDANGDTRMLGPIAAGGCANQLALVVQGTIIEDPATGCSTPLCLPIVVRSPDQNADLLVNIQDIAAFAPHWPPGPYGACQDLNNDGLVNLPDLAQMALHFNHSCEQPSCDFGCP